MQLAFSYSHQRQIARPQRRAKIFKNKKYYIIITLRIYNGDKKGASDKLNELINYIKENEETINNHAKELSHLVQEYNKERKQFAKELTFKKTKLERLNKIQTIFCRVKNKADFSY